MTTSANNTNKDDEFLSDAYDAVRITALQRFMGVLNTITRFFPNFPRDVDALSMEHKQIVEDWVQNVAEAARQTSAALASFPWTDQRMIIWLIHKCNLFYNKVQHAVCPTIDRTDAIQEVTRLMARAYRALRQPLPILASQRDDDNVVYFFEDADPSFVAEYIGLDVEKWSREEAIDTAATAAQSLL